MHSLVNDYMLPLFLKIDAKKKYVAKEMNYEIEFDELVAIILRNVGSILYEIY